MNKDMPAKKSAKTNKVSGASVKKTSAKSASKPAKQASKSVANSAVKALSKVVSKVVDKISSKKVAEKNPKKTATKPAPKDAIKAAVKPVTKPATKSAKEAKPEKTRVEKAEIDTGGTLLEMAKEEMAKVNAPIVEALEKAEKSGKFKPIKVERGNLADEKAKWQELFKRYGKEKAVNYKMSDQFEALKPINHKVLGWGFVLTNENNRLEVLFENGIKVLISNYKA